MEMVQHRPGNLEQMRNISGVGERKLELYGEDFLKIIREQSEVTKEPASD
jgi:ATP-dependent DNA helicase RecQ